MAIFIERGLSLIQSGLCYHLHAETIQGIKDRPVRCKNDHRASSYLWHETIPYDQMTGLVKLSWKQWYGVPTRLDALEIIEGRGWPEGVVNLQQAMSGITEGAIPPPRSIRRRKQWGEEGDLCDPDRLRNGEYDRAFLSTRRRNAVKSGRRIRLFCQTDGDLTEKSDALFWDGATALKLTDLLEEAGYRVEIICTVYTERVYPKSGRNLLGTLMVKGGDARLNVDQIAATLCLAGFLRTYWFYATTTVPEVVDKGLGYPTEVSEELLQETGLWTAGDIVLPHLRSQKDAIEWVKKALAIVESANEETKALTDFPPVPDDDTEDGDDSEEEEDADKGTSLATQPKENQVKEPEQGKEPERDPDTKPLESKRMIIASGNVWPNRKALGGYGFRWTQGSPTWVADDTPQARRLIDLGLEGVTFEYLT